jgi:hypothetical protein
MVVSEVKGRRNELLLFAVFRVSVGKDEKVWRWIV